MDPISTSTTPAAPRPRGREQEKRTSMARTRQIVLFGGTFDPVHNGHLIVARHIAEQCGFGRVVLVPAATPPHKHAACAAAAQRLVMLRRAVRGEDLFGISTVELHRRGPSYTFDTVQEILREGPAPADIHWVIGADMLADLPKWYRAAELLELVNVVVALRPPWDERIDAILAGLRGLVRPPALRRLARSIVRTPLIDISSTEIRRRVAASLSIRFLVPEPVRRYIENRRLYVKKEGRDC
jgi:nicotinate-nucleotide adenylyltransferase